MTSPKRDPDIQAINDRDKASLETKVTAKDLVPILAEVLKSRGSIVKLIQTLRTQGKVDDTAFLSMLENINSEDEVKTLSFCIFDDLRPEEGNRVEKTFRDESELRTILNDLWNGIPKEHASWSPYRFFHEVSMNEVLRDLLRENYYVRNRYEKYYVLAFAINHTRFHIWSKDCDAELIKWRDDDKFDVIANNYEADHAVNPVIKMLNLMGGVGIVADGVYAQEDVEDDGEFDAQDEVAESEARAIDRNYADPSFPELDARLNLNSELPWSVKQPSQRNISASFGLGERAKELLRQRKDRLETKED